MASVQHGRPCASRQMEVTISRQATTGRGRDVGYPTPPAQIRTCGFPAYGSYLGCLTAKRFSGQG